MTLLVPSQGSYDMLANIIGNEMPQNLVLRLFKNDKVPTEDDVAADYTEATFTGYAAVALGAADWTLEEAVPSVATAEEKAFTSSAGQTPQSVYGYYLTRATSGRIAWAERFADGPYTIANVDDEIAVTARMTL